MAEKVKIAVCCGFVLSSERPSAVPSPPSRLARPETSSHNAQVLGLYTGQHFCGPTSRRSRRGCWLGGAHLEVRGSGARQCGSNRGVQADAADAVSHGPLADPTRDAGRGHAAELTARRGGSGQAEHCRSRPSGRCSSDCSRHCTAGWPQATCGRHRATCAIRLHLGQWARVWTGLTSPSFQLDVHFTELVTLTLRQT